MTTEERRNRPLLGAATSTTPIVSDVSTEYRCQRCGARLSRPESVARMHGLRCWLLSQGVRRVTS